MFSCIEHRLQSNHFITMYNSGAKGNNGVAAKKNFVKRLAFIVALAAGLVLCIYLLQSKDDGVKLDWKNRRREDETHRIGRIKDNLDYNHMKGAMNRQRDAFKHGREHDKIGDKDKFRIRGEVFAGDKHKGRKHQQIEEGDDTIELIVRGELHLVDIQVSSKSLDREGYSDVFGLFCEIDWSIHKSDPSATAMFRDLASKSGCAYGSSTKRVNLDSVMKAVRKHDDSNEDQHQITAMEPTGFVFHESRCGSTLVANSLAAFSPETNRVYSESPPPINVLKACAKSRACNVEKQIELFRDVLYLMGRTNDADEKYLFFKFQSVTTLHVNLVQKAFPKIPWIFVYRDPVEVMMSHIGAGDSRSAVCMRTQHNPPQETLDLVDRFGLSMYSLSNEEYCAAYLATLCESAYNEHVISKSGRMVEYSTLPDSLMDIIPDYFLGGHATFDDRERENIIRVAQNYSKGRGNKAGEWHEDSSAKRNNASQSIMKASEKFLKPSYLALQSKI